jgi:archaellum biogenesis protein FlaJ (TadC family)
MNKKQYVLYLIDNAVTDLLYYDREEDAQLGVGEIERMVKEGEITLDEMYNAFIRSLGEQV